MRCAFRFSLSAILTFSLGWAAGWPERKETSRPPGHLIDKFKQWNEASARVPRYLDLTGCRIDLKPRIEPVPLFTSPTSRKYGRWLEDADPPVRDVNNGEH